jgi:hypothetical protein
VGVEQLLLGGAALIALGLTLLHFDDAQQD